MSRIELNERTKSIGAAYRDADLGERKMQSNRELLSQPIFLPLVCRGSDILLISLRVVWNDGTALSPVSVQRQTSKDRASVPQPSLYGDPAEIPGPVGELQEAT